MSQPWQRAEREAGLSGAVDALAGLEGSALSSLLLEVMARRAAARSPAQILCQAASDPFTRPADLDQRLMLRLDAAIAEALPPRFEAVELAPVSPLGTVSALAVAHQNKVLATTRQTEVLADPTNALALLEHVGLHNTVLDALRRQGLGVPQPVARLAVGEGHRAWVDGILPDASVSTLPGNYYQLVRLNLALPVGDRLQPVSDGGFVDWLARLRSDRKERLFISAIGTELLIRLFASPAPPP